MPIIDKFILQGLEATVRTENADRWSWSKTQRDTDKRVKSVFLPQRE
jgi:hypothetical protein